MENFILKIVTIACVSVVSSFIVLSRKDDIGFFAIIVSVIMELLTIIIIFSAEILSVIKEIIALF